MYNPILLLLCFALFSVGYCEVNLEDREVFEEFEKFLKQFNKSYTNMTEFTIKYQAFKKNFFIREKLMNNEKNGTFINETEDDDDDSRTSFGDTPFMDLTPEEFEKGYLSLNTSDVPEGTEYYFDNSTVSEGEGDDDDDEEGENEEEEKEELRFLQIENTKKKLPKHWDWRKKGAVNSVQNQGNCGGCWAFSAVANLEGVYFKKYGKLPKFSEQQLIDCDSLNSGCAGGIMHNAFTYIKQAGITDENYYPFYQSQGYCRYNPSAVTDIVKGYRFAGTESEKKIRRMLKEVGPLAITINARTLQYYNGGVIDIPYSSCPYAPNHGVNLVGYGTTKKGLKYWIVRNTWGPNWGEGGYFRIARGKGLCGVNKYVITAVLN